jgi:hypothetical protein
MPAVRPASVYLAYPGGHDLVEVNDPRARAGSLTGQVMPAPRRR